MLITVAAMILLTQEGDIVLKEPRPPEKYQQSLSATCGSHELTVRGYGHVRPQGQSPVIAVDGRRIRGDTSGATQFLAQADAVYRLSARCPAERDAIELNVVKASTDPAHLRETWAMRLTVDAAGAVLSYHEQQADADVFWFH